MLGSFSNSPHRFLPMLTLPHDGRISSGKESAHRPLKHRSLTTKAVLGLTGEGDRLSPCKGRPGSLLNWWGWFFFLGSPRLRRTTPVQLFRAAESVTLIMPSLILTEFFTLLSPPEDVPRRNLKFPSLLHFRSEFHSTLYRVVLVEDLL